MKPLLIPFPGNEPMAHSLAALLSADVGRIETRSFPDSESYLRVVDNPAGHDALLVCTLNDPNEKLLPLLFAASTLRELGAASVGLIAPYLAYMRQDKQFHPGEAVTSRTFAALLSQQFDWLATVDPHLHRYASLSDIYSIPCRVAHAAPLLAQWVRDNAPHAIIVGPDSESKQWVAEVAKEAGVPFTVLEKTRYGDRDVTITFRNPDALSGRALVLVDDIISSGKTMAEAIRSLAGQTKHRPVCIGVHGVFADGAAKALADAGARVITCNTIQHPTNAIDVAPVLAEAIKALYGTRTAAP